MSWTYYSEYKPRIKVTGGIRAQSRTGPFGSTWWGQRWIKVLESFGMGERLSRGKTYARQGQVLSIDFEAKGITSKVQGSEKKPYSVTIQLTQYDSKTWEKIIEATSRKVLFAAKLLTGNLPTDMENIFKNQKVGLFPLTDKDLKTSCSCPDWSNPCKHSAAVYCLLAEEFDRDPFVLFTLRGLSKEAFLKSLENKLGCTFTNTKSKTKKELTLPKKPYRPSLEGFWEHKPLDTPLPSPSPPSYERLGKFSFWRSEIPLHTFIKNALTSTLMGRE
jgi:hypothetical protein